MYIENTTVMASLNNYFTNIKTINPIPIQLTIKWRNYIAQVSKFT
jgi:hypothetical protein